MDGRGMERREGEVDQGQGQMGLLRATVYRPEARRPEELGVPLRLHDLIPKRGPTACIRRAIAPECAQ